MHKTIFPLIIARSGKVFFSLIKRRKRDSHDNTFRFIFRLFARTLLKFYFLIVLTNAFIVDCSSADHQFNDLFWSSLGFLNLASNKSITEIRKCHASQMRSHLLILLREALHSVLSNFHGALFFFSLKQHRPPRKREGSSVSDDNEKIGWGEEIWQREFGKTMLVAI